MTSQPPPYWLSSSLRFYPPPRGSDILVLAPDCQRLWCLDPSYLWAHFQPDALVMNMRNYMDAQSRRLHSPYDFKVSHAFQRLYSKRHLCLFPYELWLDADIDEVQVTARSTVRRILKSRDHSTDTCVHVWDDYLHYLAAQENLYPPILDNPFYAEIQELQKRSVRETRAHLEAFQAGREPGGTDLETILFKLAWNSAAGLRIVARLRERGYPRVRLFNTFEYQPVLKEMCRQAGLPLDWIAVCPAAECLELRLLYDCISHYVRLDPPNRVYHFIEDLTEATLLSGAVECIREYLKDQNGDLDNVRSLIKRDLQYAESLIHGSALEKFLIRARIADNYLSASTLSKLPDRLVLAFAQALQKKLWKSRITPHGLFCLLRKREPAVKLPNLRPDFGPRHPADVAHALGLERSSHWLYWT